MSSAKRKNRSPSPEAQPSECKWVCSICSEPPWAEAPEDTLEKLKEKLKEKKISRPPLKHRDAKAASLSDVEGLLCGHVYHQVCMDLLLTNRFNPELLGNYRCPICSEELVVKSARRKLFFSSESNVEICSDVEKKTEDMQCNSRLCNNTNKNLSKDLDRLQRDNVELNARNWSLEDKVDDLEAQIAKMKKDQEDEVKLLEAKIERMKKGQQDQVKRLKAKIEEMRVDPDELLDIY